MRAAWVLAMACVLVLVGCGGPAAAPGRMLRIGDSGGGGERYEYPSSGGGWPAGPDHTAVVEPVRALRGMARRARRGGQRPEHRSVRTLGTRGPLSRDR